MIFTNWQKVLIDAATKHIINTSGQKRFIEGSGSFQDLNGNKNISGSTMVRPWRSANSWLFMFFAVLWFSFFFTIMSVVSKNKIIIINKVSYHSWSEVLNKNPTIFIYSLLPILSIFFLYVALAKFLNKTTYSITDRGLSISYSPLPWPKNNRTYYRTEIVQIYIQQRISRSKNGSTTRSFRVAAEFKNASDAVIESGFSNYSDARILEQWIESKFNLQDVSVADEVGT